MDSPARNIVIAGGGCTGTTAVIALAQKLADRFVPSGTTLHLFDPEGFGTGGLAYGKSGAALLNDTAESMSPWNPGAFAAWCGRRGLGADPKAFQERRVFGAFLREEYESALATLAAQGIAVHEHREAVTALAPAPGGFIVAGTETVLRDVAREDIILAPGYGHNAALAALDQYQGQGYVPSLYPPARLTDEPALVRPDARILILGTGPALYDALRLLPENNSSRLTAVSSTGACPGRRDTCVEGLEARWSLTAEYNRAVDAATLSALIARDLAAAEANGSTPRRTALDIQKHLPAILDNLPAAEQTAFTRGTLSRLFHTCTPVPDSSWQVKEDLVRQGRFEILAARPAAADIKREADGFHITLDGRNRVFDAVVNCTGHDPLNQPLVKTLLAAGLAEKHGGYSVLCTTDGCHLAGSGLACIGPATHIGLHGVEAFYGAVEEAAQLIAGRTALPVLLPIDGPRPGAMLPP